MTANEIIAIAEFLGDSMTEEQAIDLADRAKHLSYADRERVMAVLEGGPLYTELSMHDAEMGGLSRY